MSSSWYGEWNTDVVDISAWLFLPAILPRDFCGPAIVYRQASAFPTHFSRHTADQIGRVADIPVGNLVFYLPITSADVEWRPVIIEVAKSYGAGTRWQHSDAETDPDAWSDWKADLARRQDWKVLRSCKVPHSFCQASQTLLNNG